MKDCETLPLGGDTRSENSADGAVMAMLGRHLAHAYSNVMQGPLPAHLQALVERLDGTELGRANSATRASTR